VNRVNAKFSSEYGKNAKQNYNLDAKKPNVKFRTGKNNNTVANKMKTWIAEQRSNAYNENPELSTSYSASEQGYTASGSSNASVANATTDNQGGNNNLYIILGAIALIVILFILFKKKG
jgi:hypothetical protein